jgi:hypothetical protein
MANADSNSINKPKNWLSDSPPANSEVIETESTSHALFELSVEVLSESMFGSDLVQQASSCGSGTGVDSGSSSTSGASSSFYSSCSSCLSCADCGGCASCFC